MSVLLCPVWRTAGILCDPDLTPTFGRVLNVVFKKFKVYKGSLYDLGSETTGQ